MEIGKIPPQAIDLEEAVLGAIMIEKALYDKIGDILPEYFYKSVNGIIMEAIKDLHRSGKPVDILTVIEQLNKSDKLDEVGGPTTVMSITARMSSGAHFDYHLSIVIQKYLQREIIKKCSEITQIAFTNEDVIEECEGMITDLQNILIDSTIGEISGRYVQTVLNQSKEIAAEKMENRKQGKDIGITIPIGVLQDILGGWQNSDLVYIAARPSMGKTAVAVKFAKHTAKKGYKTIFFSLEMNDVPIVDRAALGEVDIDPENWKNGNISDIDLEKYDRVIELMKNWPLLIIDKSSIRPEQIRAVCKKERPDIIFIDYIGLMKPNRSEKFQNRNLELGSISHELKAIAKDFNIPVIALSQLNRALDTRGNKRATLSDLRDSGELEQDADIVIFPHREYVYSKDETDKGKIEYIVAKHRNGRTGIVNGSHNKYMNDFYDYVDNEF